MLDFLPSIRKCNDKFVIVTVHLAANLVEQPRVVTLEEPNHRCIYRPIVAAP